jgi:hypothetical protein
MRINLFFVCLSSDVDLMAKSEQLATSQSSPKILTSEEIPHIHEDTEKAYHTTITINTPHNEIAPMPEVSDTNDNYDEEFEATQNVENAPNVEVADDNDNYEEEFEDDFED